jgi:hypothetical protein
MDFVRIDNFKNSSFSGFSESFLFEDDDTDEEVDFYDEEEDFQDSVEMFHLVYCEDDEGCLFNDEEDMFDPWICPDHIKWADLWRKLESNGITINTALTAYHKVLELSHKVSG